MLHSPLCVLSHFFAKIIFSKGTSVEAVINGKRHLRLLSFGENYEMDSPNLLIRIVPVPSADWFGNVKIQCRDSGLEAELCYYKSRSFFGFGGNSRSVKGKIFHSKSLKTIHEIEGQWDRYGDDL